MINIFFWLTPICLYPKESTSIEQNLVKLIIDWGYLENYHPSLISNSIDSDSLFSQLANEIIKNKTIYSLDNVLNILNNKFRVSESYNVALCAFLSQNKIRNKHLASIVYPDSLVSMKRVIYDESTNQFFFNTSIKKTQPFPTSSLRILGIAKIWNNYRFYYPYPEVLPTSYAYKNLLMKYIRVILKCNNFSDYHLAVLKFISEFRDSHSKAISFTIRNQFGVKTIPVKVKYIDGQVVINDYYDKFLFDSTKLKIGDIILQVNGESMINIFKRNKPFVAYSNSATLYRDLSRISLKTNRDSISILVKRNNSRFSITLSTYYMQDLFYKEQISKRNTSILKYNDSTLYLQCMYLDTSNLRNILINNRQLRWFIFDLRSSTTWFKSIIDDFFVQKETIFASYFIPRVSKPGCFSDFMPITVGPGKVEFLIKDPRVIILVNEDTQSQGEFQTMFLQAIPKAITIGSKTAGTDGNTSEFTIPGNILINMTALGIQYPNKKQTQKCGVKIDYHRSTSVKDVRQMADQELHLALEIIKKGG